MQKYKLLLLAVTFLLCSCLQSPRFTAPQENIVNDVKTEEILKIAENTHIINDNEELIVIADVMLSNAEKLSLDRNFQGAQQLIKVLFEILPLSDENDENTDEFLYRIASFYVEKMPPQYIDSIPQSIIAFVTLYQFQTIMNEIDTTNIDISQLQLNCTRDVLFNVPITYNKRVQQALLALLAADKSERMIRLLNRKLFYRPFMIEMYREAGLPTDITYLPLLESAFNPKAYSWAHASGLWQFIPSTGKIFGLRDSYWLDERRDPIKSTEASIAYFKRLYNMFDDWYLALASYNTGEGRVRRLVREKKKELIEAGMPEENIKVTYWDLQLPKETMNYVPLYIAYQIIAKNPKCFGYIIDSTITPFPYDTIKISDCVDMAKIAKGIGISADSLKGINPHIKQFCTPPDAKDVNLYIPLGTKELYTKFYSTLKSDDKIKWHRYKIASGDNLGSIAKKFGTTIQAIKDMNKMKNNALVAGRYILLPLPESGVDLTKIIAEEEKKAAAKPAREKQMPTAGNSEKINYKVSSGETFYSIARLYDISISDIQSWNPNITPKSLRAGDILIIYMNGQAGQQAAAATKSTQTTQTQQNIATQSQPTSGEKQKYVVKDGDNLYQISLKLNVKLSDLIEWNNKDKNKPIIRPGETLVYYSTTGEQKTNTTTQNVTTQSSPLPSNQSVINYKVQKGDTFYSIARNFSTSVAELESLNNMKASELKAEQIIKVSDNTTQTRTQNVVTQSPQSSSNGVINYRVKNGDYLYKLASQFNVSVQEICLANNFSQDRKLRAGEIIKIPNK